MQVGPYTAIVDGDALCYTIACASVVAKVIRDRMMTLLAARYPEYGWDRNSGYATREHRAAMRTHGLTPFHRRSFPAVHATIAGEQQVLGFDLDPSLAALDEDELIEAEFLASGRGPVDDGAGIPVLAENDDEATHDAEDAGLELEFAYAPDTREMSGR